MGKIAQIIIWRVGMGEKSKFCLEGDHNVSRFLIKEVAQGFETKHVY